MGADRTMSDEGWGTERDLASLPGGPPDAATLDRIAEMAGITEDAPPSEPTMDLLETAWGIIANAGWDGMAQTPGWQEAAVRWRDRYHEVLREFCASRPTPVPSAALHADGLRTDAVTEPPSARDVEEGILRQEVDCWRAEAARLRCTLAGIDFLVCPALDGGGEWPRESEGLTADVWLLVGRLKAAESEVMRLKGVTVLPGMPGAEL